MQIRARKIEPGEPTYIIAEMSANHQHDVNHAVRLVQAAHEAGADAIKLQTYTADTLTIDCDQAPFLIGAGHHLGRPQVVRSVRRGIYALGMAT